MGPPLSPVHNVLLYQLYANLQVNSSIKPHPHPHLYPKISSAIKMPTKSKSSRNTRKSIYQFKSNTANYYQHHIDESPPPKTNTTNTQSKSTSETSAIKIQSFYRAHLIKTLTTTIRIINTQVNKLQHIIQQQDTVDLIRTNQHYRLKLNEELMRLLLKLDSVKGIDQAIRELRKSVSRKIVGLQEVVDGVAGAEEWEFVMRKWEEDLMEIEGEVCRERGGCEMERFCVDKLGLVCFQRFLSGDA